MKLTESQLRQVIRKALIAEFSSPAVKSSEEKIRSIIRSELLKEIGPGNDPVDRIVGGGPVGLTAKVSLLHKHASSIKKQALSLHKEAIEISSRKFAIYPHRDALRHIVGYGFLVEWIGAKWMGKAIGELYELKGAIRSLMSGGPFDSGWKMDSANNEIGFDLAAKYSSKEQIIAQAYKLVSEGSFFIDDGKTLFKNCNNSTPGCEITEPPPGSGPFDRSDFEKQFNYFSKA
jgi:hypothetical protein